jgi:RND family efflux transporter MFP subunit
MKKSLIIIAAVILLITASGFGYYSQVYLPAQATPAPTLNTTKVRTGDISITASGAGSILPNTKESVGFRVGGVLSELTVAVGDQVVEGQVVARLDDTSARLKFYQAEQIVASYFSQESINQAEIALLSAKENLDAAVGQLEYLISTPVYYWETRLAEAQTALETLKTTVDASESDLLAAQKAVDKAQIYLASAQKEYYATYVWEVFPYTSIVVNGEGAEEEVLSYLEPTKDDIELARSEVKAGELALKDAERYLQMLQSGIDAPVGEVSAYLGSSSTKLAQAKLDLETAKQELNNYVLEAPVSGTVTGLSATVGQAIGAAPFLTIETLDQMSLRFYIEETDIGLVKPGNPVKITFKAFPEQPAEGEITFIEPALQLVDGNPAAVVWASLPKSVDFQLLSGMSADVEVIAGQALDTLLVPVQALRELAPGSYAVFIMQPNGELKMTPVSVGLMDYANAQILSGVNAGDVISTGAVETK